MEFDFERVVETLSGTGHRWYETANFCREPERAGGRDLRARHNLAYWHARDYLGLGLGGVSAIDGQRWRNTPRLSLYLAGLGAKERPPRRGSGGDGAEALTLTARGRFLGGGMTAELLA